MVERAVPAGVALLEGRQREPASVAGRLLGEDATALDAGTLPCSGGERRIFRLAASLAAGLPVNLRDTLTGLDEHNLTLTISAFIHASGHRPPHLEP